MTDDVIVGWLTTAIQNKPKMDGRKPHISKSRYRTKEAATEAAIRFRQIGYIATVTPVYVKQRGKLKKAQAELSPSFNADWKLHT
jgi:hypothetical protein